MQKTQVDLRSAGIAVNGVSDSGKKATARDSTVSGTSTLVQSKSGDSYNADDDASTKGMTSPPSSMSETHSYSTSDVTNGSAININDGIPTITISTEAEVEKEVAEREKQESDGSATTPNGDSKEYSGVDKTAATLEKPLQVAGGDKDGENGDTSSSVQDSFSFSNKRLCERWLDNLFMVLYEVSVLHI